MKTSRIILKTSMMALAGIIISNFASYGQAKIHVTETVMNIGTINQSDPAFYNLKVVNIGDEPLVFNHVKTSCGCDVATWPKEPILPGDTTIVKYKYDSKRLGIINKTMTMSTNDPENPRVVIRSKGEVLKNLGQRKEAGPVN